MVDVDGGLLVPYKEQVHKVSHFPAAQVCISQDCTNYVLFVGNWQNISVDATARALDISKIR